MANIRTGSIVADIRGKVGTEVYSRNAYGPYVRSPGTWVQPDTQRQLDARAVITALSQAWSGTLSEAQRSDWRKYGHQWPRPNRLGELSVTSGYIAWIRVNAHHYRQYTAIGFPDPPPSGPIYPPTFSFTAAANETGLVALPPTNYTTPPADLRLYLHAGAEVNPGVAYFSGPWRYIGPNTRCADCMHVSGNPNPDSTGVYHRDGDYGSMPKYKRTDNAYYIWATAPPGPYWISPAPGQPLPGSWFRVLPITGQYTPFGTYAGNPVVADVGWTIDPWTITWPFALTATKKVFAYAVAQLADSGEISTPCRAQTIVTA